MHRRLLMPSWGTATGGMHDCAWSLYLEPIEMVMVSLHDADMLDEFMRSEPKVPTLGDEAYWVFDSQLWVRKGDRVVSVIVMTDTVNAKDASIAIARHALTRLP